MQKEIEIKIFEIDVKKIVKQLLSLWVIKRYDTIIETWYYTVETNGWLSDRQKFLRIRKTWDTYKLTYKYKTVQDNFQVNDEIDVPLEDMDNMVDILERLWHKQYDYIKKHRLSYALQDIVFDIDTHEWIPAFMEIEAPSIEWVKAMMKQLWLDKHPVSGHGYTSIKKIWYNNFITQIKQEQWIL